jgi:hypothetical protein
MKLLNNKKTTKMKLCGLFIFKVFYSGLGIKNPL